MNRLYFLIVPTFLFLFCGLSNAGQDESKNSDFGEPKNLGVFVNSVESGDAYWETLITAIRNNKLSLNMLSPSAVANYMEVLANEGMLELIPLSYYDNDEIKTALDVVFQEPKNIPDNWNVFEEHWLLERLCSR